MLRTGLSRRLAVAASLLWASLAGAEPLRVTAPADGDVLRGGSLATIAWTATAALPAEVVEWEAFLSVDGGRYFSTRITPHLDIDIRSFEWHVPNVSSNDVRLLIRIGDEREEKSLDVPLRLSIVADPSVRMPIAQAARERGESARPGDPGVALWASGDRGGRQVVQERAAAETSWRGGRRRETPRGEAWEGPPVLTKIRPGAALASLAAVARRARASSPLLARDILVLVRRRNI
jgi:hypothetical protein